MRLVIVEPRGSGGMIHYAYQLCNAMAEIGEDVMLITAKEYELDGYPHKFQVNKFLNLWSHIDPLQTAITSNRLDAVLRKILRSVRRVFRGIRLFAEWIKLTRYLLRLQPDIVQFGEIEFPFESLFLNYLKSQGLIISQVCHEFEPRERSANLLVRINNYLLLNVFRAFSVMFFHSTSNKDRFLSLYPDISSSNFHIIPMGNGQIFPVSGNMIDLQKDLIKRYQINDNDRIVLFFGNITPSKGVPDLLQAFVDVHAKDKNARLIIAGKPLKYLDVDALVDSASVLGIEAVTMFDMRYLPMDEVAPLLALATVVVYPYVSSTQSASIQAAYAVGKPVVATRVGGLPDIVEDGQSGFLVSPSSPSELSAAILKITQDEKLAQKMGLYAKTLSETRFAWEPIATQIINIYKAYLRSAQR